MDQSPQTTNDPVAPKRSRSRAQLVITTVVIVCALAAIAIAVYLLMNPNGVQTTASDSTAQIIITENGVAPSAVTIKKGESVTWVNQDGVTHGIMLTDPNPPAELEGFGSEPLAKDESYSFLFEAAGTFTYEDPQNPGRIQGTVTVEDK